MSLRHWFAVGASLLVAFSCLFVLGSETPAPRSGASLQRADRPAPRARSKRSRHDSPLEVKPREPMPGESMSDRELARATLDDLRGRTDDFLSRMQVPDVAIAVQSQHEILAHTVHDLLESSPEAEAAFVEELEARLCDEAARRQDLLLFAKLGLRLDGTKGRALSCLLAKTSAEDETVEDDVLWAALDLWQASGHAPLPEILVLSERARDPRTLRRLTRDPLDARQAHALSP